MEVPPSEIEVLLNSVENNTEIPGYQMLQGVIFEKLNSFFDFLNPDAHIVIENKLVLENEIENFTGIVDEHEMRLRKEHRLFPYLQIFFWMKGNSAIVLNIISSI